jgi:hypothetical protein
MPVTGVPEIWRRYLRPSRRRRLGVLAGVLVALSAFGVSTLIVGTRADVIRAGDRRSATVVGGERSRLPIDRFTVVTEAGTVSRLDRPKLRPDQP